jgi:hypothetical protein
MTVDRRYYHVNEPGGEQYFEINLQPGYQRLCGRQALEFVANRHEDTSLTRDARDQRFLLEVKAQYGATLFENRDKFERILGRAVETDLHGSGEVLDLLKLLVQSQGKPVRQVHFNVNLLPTYDTATPQQIHESVQSFLTGTAPISHSHAAAAVAGAHNVHHGSTPGLTLTPTTSAELDAARSAAPNLAFPLEYPRARDSNSAATQDTLRLYRIRDPAGRVHQAYVAVIDRGQLGEFYDVQGTDWADPPLLGSPSQETRIGNRTYGLFYAGEQIRVVAWHEGGAAYWIQNTLTDSLSPRTMLAIAQQTVPVISTAGTGAPPPAPGPVTFNVPQRTAVAASVTSKIGAGLGFAGLAIVAALAMFVLVRQRELTALREQIAQAMAIEARSRPLLAAAGLAQGEFPVQSQSAPPAAQAPPATGAQASSTGPPAQSTATAGLTIYRARRRPRRRAIAAGAVVLVLIAAIAVRALTAGPAKTSPAAPFTLPVAVLNATHSSGAAHGLARTLAGDHVHVGEVGDINSTLGPGAYVLYPQGARAEAERVTSLIASLSPHVLAIQPQVQSVIGGRAEIVIVLG